MIYDLRRCFIHIYSGTRQELRSDVLVLSAFWNKLVQSHGFKHQIARTRFLSFFWINFVFTHGILYFRKKIK
jgi:hypothetical protein